MGANTWNKKMTKPGLPLTPEKKNHKQTKSGRRNEGDESRGEVLISH